jgi:hypothetical protein
LARAARVSGCPGPKKTRSSSLEPLDQGRLGGRVPAGGRVVILLHAAHAHHLRAFRPEGWTAGGRAEPAGRDGAVPVCPEGMGWRAVTRGQRVNSDASPAVAWMVRKPGFRPVRFVPGFPGVPWSAAA